MPANKGFRVEKEKLNVVKATPFKNKLQEKRKRITEIGIKM
jgi:hypothetical protein